MNSDLGAEELSKQYKRLIREIPDFPRPGIGFKDITPLLRDGPAFREVVDHIATHCELRGVQPDVVACPEARGFIFGAALAYRLGAGFVPIRKSGKLPYTVAKAEYALEYGTDTVEMHIDAVSSQQKVLLVDDLLATGGTISACLELLAGNGATVVGCAFLVELTFLNGREKLGSIPVFSLMQY